jgi:hypothetical protein
MNTTEVTRFIEPSNVQAHNKEVRRARGKGCG